MLELMRKGQLSGRERLSEAEDLALRRAFGRFALRAAWESGASVVRAALLASCWTRQYGC